MDPSPGAVPLAPEPPATLVPEVTAAPRPLLALPRWLALIEAVLVCGIPTQIVLFLALWFGGLSPFAGDKLSLEFFAILSLLDTAAIALLIRLFLGLSGERSNDVFIGRKPVAGEVWRGLLLVPVVFMGVMGLVLALTWIAPWLKTVEKSPLEDFMRTPTEATIFLVVVVLAGGVREELQRAFILHRFDRVYFELRLFGRSFSIGGIRLGLVLFSIIFGLLHLDQGAHVALPIGLLGLFWGLLYVRRRSAMMAMVNHAGFNSLQVIAQMLARSL